MWNTTNVLWINYPNYSYSLKIFMSVAKYILSSLFCWILIRKDKQRRISRDDEHIDTSIFSEHQRELNDTTNCLELEEIPQNETGDIAEEVITVEYMNLTSQRVPIGQFLQDLPKRKEEGILEKEFNACFIIFNK